MLITIITITQ